MTFPILRLYDVATAFVQACRAKRSAKSAIREIRHKAGWHRLPTAEDGFAPTDAHHFGTCLGKGIGELEDGGGSARSAPPPNRITRWSRRSRRSLPRPATNSNG